MVELTFSDILNVSLYLYCLDVLDRSILYESTIYVCLQFVYIFIFIIKRDFS